MVPSPDDPRLRGAGCDDLQPVRILHSNPWFTLCDRGGYFTLEHHQPQVIVLPVVEGTHLILVRANRPVLADWPVELPAGGSRKGEKPHETAARELEEETGVKVLDLNRFVACPPLACDPNRNPCLAHVFQIELTMDEYRDRSTHDTEIKETLLMTRDECLAAIGRGELYVATPVAVICRYLLTDRLNDNV
jgi:8-oxo-dGTP pyrophosphatase MutT (NUDIX family)